MKYLAFILFIFFSIQLSYAQKDSPAPVLELNVQTEGGGTQDVVEFKVIPLGL